MAWMCPSDLGMHTVMLMQAVSRVITEVPPQLLPGALK